MSRKSYKPKYKMYQLVWTIYTLPHYDREPCKTCNETGTLTIQITTTYSYAYQGFITNKTEKTTTKVDLEFKLFSNKYKAESNKDSLITLNSKSKNKLIRLFCLNKLNVIDIYKNQIQIHMNEFPNA